VTATRNRRSRSIRLRRPQRKIPAAKYRDKIVLIGATAAGLGSAQVTPIAPVTAPVLTLAHTVSSILGEHFFVVPTWSPWVERLVFLLVAIYLIAVLPRMRAAIAGILSLAIAVALIAAHFALMVTQLMWIQLMRGAIAGGRVCSADQQTLSRHRARQGNIRCAIGGKQPHARHRLSGAGQLDMAWDMFRKCPVNDAVMENLYSLALDFERKRQFNKAESALRYMSEYNPKFRDLEQRLNRAKPCPRP